MHTLQEFIGFTKGWEYIIAIAAVLVFIGFWKFLSGTASPEKGRHGNDDLA